MANKRSKKMTGLPVVAVARPAGWRERQISGSAYSHIIQDARQIPKVLSCMIGLCKMALLGFDWKITPIDESDDTQSKAIDKLKKDIRRIDKKIGRVSKSKAVGTIGMVRQTMSDTLSFRQSVWEYAVASEGGINIPTEVQNIPSNSLFKSPIQWNTGNLIPDKLLPGIVYDNQADELKIYQTRDTLANPVELGADQIIYIEDLGVPPDTSFLTSLVPSIEQWKEMRKNLMVALHRGYAAPNEVAQIDVNELARAKEAGIIISIDELIAYATSMIQNQGIETAKLSLPGMKLQYPSIPLATDPTNPDRYLIQEIISHFFMRDITESLAAAVSTTTAPAKAIIDALVSSYRETNGRPWEKWWYDVYLEPNGYGDLELTFDWWDWTPMDKVAFTNMSTTKFKAGGLLINEYRALNGDDPLSDEEKTLLYEEQQALKSPKMQQPGMMGPQGGGQPAEPAGEELPDWMLELLGEPSKIEEQAGLSKEEQKLLNLLRKKGQIAEKIVNAYFK